MKMHKKTQLSLALTGIMAGSIVPSSQAESVTEAITSGNAVIDMRLRYESVEQDNAVQDASALTLRTRLGYSTGSVSGFSATIELEDNRIVLGEGDYTVGPSGYNPGIYSVIADPEFTELDQGFVQYKTEKLTAKVGRQVIALDNHRFVGHVGWRQDRQTFDAFSAKYSPLEKLTMTYAYIDQRNRIFGEDADLDAKDHLFNVSYKSPIGTFTGYGYLLEVDNDTDNSLDTYGISLKGSQKVSDSRVLYAFEYATQSSETATTDFDADYIFLEAGFSISGITAKIGYEVLGSDDGGFGFSTPLATLHKFNGWADQFLGTPAQGLVDTSVTLSGGLGGGKWTAIYHRFEADKSTDTIDDLGSEIDLLFTKKIGKHYSAGIKYAAFSGKSGRVDADKLWLWVGAKF